MFLTRLVPASIVIVGIGIAFTSQKRLPVDEHIAHMAAVDLAVAPVRPSSAQGTAGIPASNNSAAARLKASNRHSEWVKIPWEPGSKDSLMAWVVYPTTSNAKTPVVVVVHENIGLTTWVRGVADQVAADGFIAIAPDLISRVRGGPSTDELTPDSVRKIISGVPNSDKVLGVTAVAKYAMSLSSAAPRYAVIGYCWGGSTTWYNAINGGAPGFSGGVAFYGTPYMAGGAPNADSLAKISKPIMLLNGSKDGRIASAMPAIDSIMKAKGKDYVGVNYEGAVHGFLRAQDDPRATNPDPVEQAANLAAAKDGWPRTIAFLRKNLGVK
jgi:carboxymethylenebutenolidase